MVSVNIGASLALAIDAFNIDGIVFDPDGMEGNVFVDYAPASLDRVVLTTVTSNSFEMGLGMEQERYTEALIQVRDVDQMDAYELTETIAKCLHADRDGTYWPTLDDDEVKIIFIQTNNVTFYGFDDNNMPMYFIEVKIRWVEPEHHTHPPHPPHPPHP